MSDRKEEGKTKDKVFDKGHQQRPHKPHKPHKLHKPHESKYLPFGH